MPDKLHLPSFDDLLASVGQTRGSKRISWNTSHNLLPLCVPTRSPSTPPIPSATPSSFATLPMRSSNAQASASEEVAIKVHQSSISERCEHYQDRVELLRKQSSESLDWDIPMPSTIANRPLHFRSFSHPSATPPTSGFQYKCHPPPPSQKPITAHNAPHANSPLTNGCPSSVPSAKSNFSCLDKPIGPSVYHRSAPKVKSQYVHQPRHRNSDSMVSSWSASSEDPYDGRYEVSAGGKVSQRELPIGVRIPSLPRRA